MNQPNHFRKKPVVIEAMLHDGDAGDMMAVYNWIERNTQGSYDTNAPDGIIPESGVSINAETGFMVIATLEGEMQVKVGDWVIRGVQGEFYPCKPDIFNQTYEPAFEEESKDNPCAEAPKEWIERQEEERRAWSIGEAIRFVKEFDAFDTATLITSAGMIEEFVKGKPEEDPDLHDQQALDTFGVVMTELIRDTFDEGIMTREQVSEFIDRCTDTLTKMGVRFKNGNLIDI